MVSCLALIDPQQRQTWLIDCTPDFPSQLRLLQESSPRSPPADRGVPAITGILLTHAHMGHYTGLMHLGRESMNTREVPVYAMPRMKSFLAANGPWSQLVELRNIILRDLQSGRACPLNDRIRVTPLLVPHRDEFSETVGFRMEGPRRSILYLPDIDKWDRWELSLEDQLRGVDVAYLDGTFFADGELPGRPISEVPHPFITETITRLSHLPLSERSKVRFIHLNHTNPALRENSAALQTIRDAGYFVAEQGERQGL